MAELFAELTRDAPQEASFLIPELKHVGLVKPVISEEQQMAILKSLERAKGEELFAGLTETIIAVSTVPKAPTRKKRKPIGVPGISKIKELQPPLPPPPVKPASPLPLPKPVVKKLEPIAAPPPPSETVVDVQKITEPVVVVAPRKKVNPLPLPLPLPKEKEKEKEKEEPRWTIPPGINPNCMTDIKNRVYCNIEDAKKVRSVYADKGDKPLFPFTIRPYNPMIDTVVASTVGSAGGIYLPVMKYETLKDDPGEKNYATTYLYEPNSEVVMYLGKNVGVFGDRIHAFMYLETIYQNMKKSTSYLSDRFNEYLETLLCYKAFISKFVQDTERYVTGKITSAQWLETYLWVFGVHWKNIVDNPTVQDVIKWHLSVYHSPEEVGQLKLLLSNGKPIRNVWDVKMGTGKAVLPVRRPYDFLDFYINILGQYCGLDTIILQREPEPSDTPDFTSTLIIDLRNYPYNHLCRLSEDFMSYRPPNRSVMPSHWFPSQGFLESSSTGSVYKWVVADYSMHKDLIFNTKRGGVFTFQSVGEPPKPIGEAIKYRRKRIPDTEILQEPINRQIEKVSTALRGNHKEISDILQK